MYMNVYDMYYSIYIQLYTGPFWIMTHHFRNIVAPTGPGSLGVTHTKCQSPFGARRLDLRVAVNTSKHVQDWKCRPFLLFVICFFPLMDWKNPKNIVQPHI